MNQLLKEYKIEVKFPSIKREFTIMIKSDLTGLQMKEEFCQIYDTKRFDIDLYFNDVVLNENQSLIQQGVGENGIIIIKYAIPITILLSSANKKYCVRLTLETTTMDLQQQLMDTYSYQNVVVTFYKDEEILLPELSLYDQGINKNNIIKANVKQRGG
ncbi:unnamed protein product [Paramecium pentaurelia]|uniref:Ubiquitin-like domain-containing protein n=1 Tax=Paramecium pentaurelia TaxID=43138 RepID=A0A8S1TU86_9CILI|nr:unnamed protein product [Paramecium pentaurelia]